MKIEMLDPCDLHEYRGNARAHSVEQIGQIMASIQQFGFNNPVLIDENNQIIAGHGRCAAATSLGLTAVPCVRLAHLAGEDYDLAGLGFDLEDLGDMIDGGSHPDGAVQIDASNNKDGIIPFGYMGGKFSKLKFILPLLIPESREAKHFIDGYCGSAAVGLNRQDPNTGSVTINDLNGDIINFFRQLRNNTDELTNQIKLTPYTREEYMDNRVADWGDQSEVERARRLYAHITQSFSNGPNKMAGWRAASEGGNPAAQIINRDETLIHVALALRSIHIENKPVMELLDQYGDKSETLIYLDPPYLMRTGDNYRGDYGNTEQDHISLLTACNQAAAMIAISHYPSEIYSEHLKGWHCFSMEAEAKMAQTERGKSKGKRIELLYTNYQPSRRQT